MANESGIAAMPRRRGQAARRDDDGHEAADRCERGQERVLRRVQGAAQEVGEALERHRDGKDGEDPRGAGDIGLVERTSAEQDPDRQLGHDDQREGRRRGEDQDGGQVRAEQPEEACADRPRRPPIESAGKAAMANDAPMRLTGTLWKLRAKLTELTDPAASVDATEVKYRNVSGSMGWLAILGTISRRNSPTPCVRSRKLGTRAGTLVREMPTTRIARWATAPPRHRSRRVDAHSSGQQDSVPATIPPL